MSGARGTHAARRYDAQLETPAAPASPRLIDIALLVPSVAHQALGLIKEAAPFAKEVLNTRRSSTCFHGWLL